MLAPLFGSGAQALATEFTLFPFQVLSYPMRGVIHMLFAKKKGPSHAIGFSRLKWTSIAPTCVHQIEIGERIRQGVSKIAKPVVRQNTRCDQSDPQDTAMLAGSPRGPMNTTVFSSSRRESSERVRRTRRRQLRSFALRPSATPILGPSGNSTASSPPSPLIAMTRLSLVDGYRGLNSSRLAELRMATTAGCCSFRSALMA
jgi:hypothetical protein